MKICFASHNKNKIKELQNLLGEDFDLVGLDDLGITEEIPETGTTLEENALIKAEFVSSRFAIPCFADDTGLLVDALDGAPGVYSARYAGEPANSENNINKLLIELRDVNDREARFKTVIAYLDKKDKLYFVGEVEGAITHERTGEEGFGYDPVFIPKGFNRTFAEMTMEEKNSISHRGRAVQKLAAFLSNQK